jgi:hypothetical protein
MKKSVFWQVTGVLTSATPDTESRRSGLLVPGAASQKGLSRKAVCLCEMKNPALKDK